MEDIRIYDWDLNLLHIQHDITSDNWTLYYNDIGTCELHFPISGKIVEKIGGSRRLLVIQGDKQAVVTGIEHTTEFVLYGRTLNWFLSKRSVPSFKSSELVPRPRNAETMARWVFEKSYISNETTAANDPDFILGELAGLEDSPDYNFWRNTRNTSSDVIKEALDAAGAGHRLQIDLQAKKWVFSVMLGQERPLLLSEGNKNAYDMSYSSDILDLSTCGWYEYTPDTEEEATEETETTWEYIEAENPQEGRYRMEAVLSGSNLSEAQSALAKLKEKNELQAKTRRLVYGTDYSLGDIFRTQYKRGGFSYTGRRRITGVNIWHGHSDSGEQPIMEDVENGNTL